jgi:hypothetical protein
LEAGQTKLLDIRDGEITAALGKAIEVIKEINPQLLLIDLQSHKLTCTDSSG